MESEGKPVVAVIPVSIDVLDLVAFGEEETEDSAEIPIGLTTLRIPEFYTRLEKKISLTKIACWNPSRGQIWTMGAWRAILSRPAWKIPATNRASASTIWRASRPRRTNALDLFFRNAEYLVIRGKSNRIWNTANVELYEIVIEELSEFREDLLG